MDQVADIAPMAVFHSNALFSCFYYFCQGLTQLASTYPRRCLYVPWLVLLISLLHFHRAIIVPYLHVFAFLNVFSSVVWAPLFLDGVDLLFGLRSSVP